MHVGRAIVGEAIGVFLRINITGAIVVFFRMHIGGAIFGGANAVFLEYRGGSRILK